MWDNPLYHKFDYCIFDIPNKARKHLNPIKIKISLEVLKARSAFRSLRIPTSRDNRYFIFYRCFQHIQVSHIKKPLSIISFVQVFLVKRVQNRVDYIFLNFNRQMPALYRNADIVRHPRFALVPSILPQVVNKISFNLPGCFRLICYSIIAFRFAHLHTILKVVVYGLTAFLSRRTFPIGLRKLLCTQRYLQSFFKTL